LKSVSICIVLCGLFFKPCWTQQRVADYSIGNDSVQIITDTFPTLNASIVFVNLHENEQTSVNAAKKFLMKEGGIMIRLQQSGNRNIGFRFNNKNYVFDPNRIFTAAGRKDNLNKLSFYDNKADSMLQAFANEILQPLSQYKLIVALHNNTNNNFSINSFKKGGKEAKNAKKVYTNAAMDADDFVLTTEAAVYNFLKQQQINVVLQNNEACDDDGSLSVYCGRNNIPYINIEAEIGHEAVQEKIISLLAPLFKVYNAPLR